MQLLDAGESALLLSAAADIALVINADGTIARGYMIERCELQGENRYVITWKVALQGEAKTNFAGTIGSSLDEAVAPGLITVGLAKDPHQMQVHTYDPAGKPARLKAVGGTLALESLNVPGFAVGAEMDFKSMVPMKGAST